MSFLKWPAALKCGFHPDKRRRRRQHRRQAKELFQYGGGNCRQVALWHLQQARMVKTQPKQGRG